MGTVMVILMMWRVFHQMEHSTFVDGVWTVAVLFPVWVCGAWMAGQWGSAALAVSRRKWIGAILLCIMSECLLVVLKVRQYPGWALHLVCWSSIPGLMLFLAGAHHARLSARAWAEPICRWLGQFSYPCYILHMQLLLLLDHVTDIYAREFVLRHPLLHTLLEFVVVVALLVVTGPWLERFFLRWRGGVLESLRVRTVVRV